MYEDIHQLSEKLLQYNRTFLKTYIDGREKGITHDFEKVIKPFVNEVKEVNEEWKTKAKEWLKRKDLKHLHVRQVETTSEHIDQLSIQSFFPENSRTRFLNANRTVEFFLIELLKEINK